MPLGATLALAGALTLVGIAIRLAVTRGLSVDEIRTVGDAHLSLGSLISRLAHGGTSPPLHPILEWLAARLLGTGDLAARVPSLLAGAALAPAVGWLAAELFDRRTAVLATALAALAPGLVWYSQEASDYALVALFGTLAIIGAARAGRYGRPGDWALHTVAAALAVWSDWSGAFVVLATEIALTLALLARRQAREPLRPFLTGWTIATLALACQLVPLAVLLSDQISSRGGIAGVMSVGASGLSFYAGVSNVSWALFGFHPGIVTSTLSAIWPLAMLASLVAVGRGMSGRGSLLQACVVVPVLCVFALGVIAPQAFDVRYMIAAVPPAMVLLARASISWPRTEAVRALAAAAIVAVLVGALLDQQLDRSNPRRYDYRQALAQVQADGAEGASVLFAPANLSGAIARYAPGLHASPLSTSLPTRAQARSVVVMTSFSGERSLVPLLNRDFGALRATRRLISFHSYPGIDVWLYS